MKYSRLYSWYVQVYTVGVKYGLYMTAMTAGYIYVSRSILFQTEQQMSSSSISVKSNIVSRITLND